MGTTLLSCLTTTIAQVSTIALETTIAHVPAPSRVRRAPARVFSPVLFPSADFLGGIFTLRRFFLGSLYPRLKIVENPL